MFRFTKTIVEKFIEENEGYESAPRSYEHGRYHGTTRYYIKNKEVHQVESASTMEGPSDQVLDIDRARKFFKSELNRLGNKLKTPKDI